MSDDKKNGLEELSNHDAEIIAGGDDSQNVQQDEFLRMQTDLQQFQTAISLATSQNKETADNLNNVVRKL